MPDLVQQGWPCLRCLFADQCSHSRDLFLSMTFPRSLGCCFKTCTQLLSSNSHPQDLESFILLNWIVSETLSACSLPSQPAQCGLLSHAVGARESTIRGWRMTGSQAGTGSSCWCSSVAMAFVSPLAATETKGDQMTLFMWAYT